MARLGALLIVALTAAPLGCAKQFRIANLTSHGGRYVMAEVGQRIPLDFVYFGPIPEPEEWVDYTLILILNNEAVSSSTASEIPRYMQISVSVDVPGYYYGRRQSAFDASYGSPETGTSQVYAYVEVWRGRQKIGESSRVVILVSCAMCMQ